MEKREEASICILFFFNTQRFSLTHHVHSLNATKNRQLKDNVEQPNNNQIERSARHIVKCQRRVIHGNNFVRTLWDKQQQTFADSTDLLVSPQWNQCLPQSYPGIANKITHVALQPSHTDSNASLVSVGDSYLFHQKSHCLPTIL